MRREPLVSAWKSHELDTEGEVVDDKQRKTKARCAKAGRDRIETAAAIERQTNWRGTYGGWHNESVDSAREFREAAAVLATAIERTSIVDACHAVAPLDIA